MSIIRVKHNRENPYVSLNKSILFDENLSLKAKGLWAQCLARPDDWKFYVNEIIKNCKEGKKSIYAAIDELIQRNYAMRMENFEKSEDGKFTKGGVEYVFFEFAASDEEKEQCLQEFKKSLPRIRFGDPRNGRAQKEQLLNNDSLQSKDKELFCIPKSVASDFKKNSSVQEKKKEALELAQESLKMPGTITKPTPDGKSITTTLNDVFAESLRRRSDWMTKEIHDAWKIYAEYQGAIRDPLRFIEGTIKNLRNEKKVNYLKKQGKICTNDQLMTSTSSKENSSAKDTKEHPSLGALLEMEEKMQKKC